MRITNKKFNDTVKNVIENISRRELQEYRIDGISFYNVNLKKKRTYDHIRPTTQCVGARASAEGVSLT